MKLSGFILSIVLALACQQSNLPFEKGSNPEKNYADYCASCHGIEMDAFVDRRWKYGSTDADLIKAIKIGYDDDGMPGFAETFTDQEVQELVDYIQTGIANVDQYSFDNNAASTIIETEELTLTLDTVAQGFDIPWGLTVLENGNMLIAEKGGTLYKKTPDGTLKSVTGIPKVKSRGQGGLMDVEVDPDYKNNGWVYLAYSKPHQSNNEATTAITRGRINQSGAFVDQEELFEALPYSSRNHHYGVRMEFDNEGYLFFSVGDRGDRDNNPQSLDNHCGKIHRIHPDGSIPKDNPFVGTPGAMPSIYAYGNRNPQGVALNPSDGSIWSNEHGPRGGDEINIIRRGKNYGWPIISYGINYNGTTFTEKTQQTGMEEPVMYWLPSIGVCGMTFVKSDKYKGWENNVLSGSLRFKYLERGVIKNNKIVHQEKLLENIGRLRVVEVGPDGYIYVGVETPGMILKLMPTDE